MELGKLADIERDQYQTLLEISRLLAAPTYQGGLIDQALDLIIRVVGAERGLVARYDRSADVFSVLSGRGEEGASMADLSDFSSGMLRQVVEKRQAVLIHDVQSAPEVSQFSSVQIHHIQSAIGVPVFQDGDIWGVIMLDSRKQRVGFSEENLIFLEFYANMVSLALQRITQFERLENENRMLRQQSGTVPAMIGTSPAMQKLFALIHKVAPSDATVLLLGESGTGKELAARAIHEMSTRKNNTFLAQFCGAIPDTLLESELFGHKKGAFTGAVADKKGLFEIASGGTFLLDEVGDISAALQAKLLRVLQNQEIIRLGETAPRRVNVRIVAATNQDLAALSRDGRFRQDLYYRLNVFPITLPPLRERRDDIPLLADHFVQQYGLRPMRLTPGAAETLLKYPWPGNVRQLENVIRRALILAEGNRITPEHIIIEDAQETGAFSGTLEEYERMLLKKRLEEFSGNRTRTAKSLGVSVRWVQMKLHETGI